MLSLLPHGRVSKQVEYKASEYGIKVVLVDESYTCSHSFAQFKELSGVDSLKNLAVSKENYTPEARKYRGLFKSILGLVNADVNGARNILKKFKKRFYDCITGLKQTIRIRVFSKLKSSPKSARVYGQIGVARCGDKSIDLGDRREQHLSGIRWAEGEQPPWEATDKSMIWACRKA